MIMQVIDNVPTAIIPLKLEPILKDGVALQSWPLTI
jgi:hypothetical protein